jgi:hypothetical protein
MNAFKTRSGGQVVDESVANGYAARRLKTITVSDSITPHVPDYVKR